MYNFLILQWYVNAVQLFKFTVINQKGWKLLLKGKSRALLSAPSPSQFWHPWFSPPWRTSVFDEPFLHWDIQNFFYSTHPLLIIVCSTYTIPGNLGIIFSIHGCNVFKLKEGNLKIKKCHKSVGTPMMSLLY